MNSSPTAVEFAANLRRLWKNPGDSAAYVIVDAAQDYAPVVLLREEFQKSPRTLFEGEAAAAMAEVAPYVSPVDVGGPFLDMWCDRWGGNHGVMFTSSADAEKLQQHLRKIFVVKDDSGQEYFFRYYDPRVLRAYLPTCTVEELQEFFGPITSWCCEAETPDMALVFVPSLEGVVQTEIPLASAR